MKRIPFRIVAFLVVLCTLSGLLWWYYTSPQYSLKKVRTSIADHDITSFEKYVDLDSVLSRLVNQAMNMVAEELESGLFGKQGAALATGLLKTSLESSAREHVRAFVERGQADSPSGESSPLSDAFKNIPISTFAFEKVKKIERMGKTCTVALDMYVGAYDAPVTIEFLMRDKGPYWQIAEISNLQAFLRDIKELKKTYPERNLYGTSIFLARSMDETYRQSASLARVAAELAAKGRSAEADIYFSESLDLAKNIKERKMQAAQNKCEALKQISIQLARSGSLDSALETADSIESVKDHFPRQGSFEASTYRDDALAGITTDLLKVGEIDRAIDTATRMKNHVRKIGTICETADEFAKADRKADAKRALEATLRIADEGEDHSAKAWGLLSLAKSFAAIDEQSKAEQIVDRILDEVSHIENPPLRHRVLLSLSCPCSPPNGSCDQANALFRNHLGQERIQAIYAEARETAENMDDKGPFGRGLLLFSLVNTLTGCEDIEEAYKTARAMDDSDHMKKNALQTVAKAFLEREQEDRAFEIASLKVFQGWWNLKASLLQDIVLDLLKQGNAEEALARAKSITDDYYHDGVFYRYSLELAENGEFEAALHMAENIRTHAYDKAWRKVGKVDAVAGIAIEMAKAGKAEEAVALLSEIDHEEEKRDACFEIALHIASTTKTREEHVATAKRIMNLAGQ